MRRAEENRGAPRGWQGKFPLDELHANFHECAKIEITALTHFGEPEIRSGSAKTFRRSLLRPSSQNDKPANTL
jgi:hypothetical protein